MRLKKSLVVTILGICVFMLVGCHQPLMPTDSPLSTPFGSQSTASAQPTPTFAALPSPLAGMATVRGKLVRDLPTGKEPLADTKILLASVIRSEEGTPMVAAASEETSPIVVTGKDGSFVFTNVTPGTYGIVVVTPIGLFLIQDENGNNLLFTVQSGVVLDLGEIRTTLPY